MIRTPNPKGWFHRAWRRFARRPGKNEIETGPRALLNAEIIVAIPCVQNTVNQNTVNRRGVPGTSI
jgi:hypothetical protein